MPDLNTLSEAQRKVYDLLAQGRNSEQIARELDTTLGVVEAQKTRIRTKGIPLPGEGPRPADTPPPATHVPVGHLPPVEPLPRLQSTGGSDNDRIAAQLTGKALNADELAKLAEKVAGTTAKDIHPMVLLGCTIQYVKLCGGRMTAHQVIEDVYGALRAFAGNTGPDAGGQTEPMPQSEREQLAFLREQNEILRSENTNLKRQTGSSYSSN